MLKYKNALKILNIFCIYSFCISEGTWFAVQELQVAELHVKAVIRSGHDFFKVAGVHSQLRKIFLAQTCNLRKIKQVAFVYISSLHNTQCLHIKKDQIKRMILFLH